MIKSETMAENTKELELIRMLIQQNGESLQMVRSMLERAKEKDAQETERFKEVMQIIHLSGAPAFLAKKLATPRVAPSVEPKEKTG